MYREKKKEKKKGSRKKEKDLQTAGVGVCCARQKKRGGESGYIHIVI